MSKAPVTVYFQRGRGTIDGILTVQAAYNGKPFKRFEQIPVRSGQQSHADLEWIRGKSPIPFGDWFLHLASYKPDQWPGDSDNIGEFFPISSSPIQTQIIYKGHLKREAIGLHPENNFKGSAGCIVALHDTPEYKASVSGLFQYLRTLRQGGYEHLALKVF